MFWDVTLSGIIVLKGIPISAFECPELSPVGMLQRGTLPPHLQIV